MSVKFTTIPSKRLAESITASSTTIRLNNILTWDGSTDLTSSDVGTALYAILRNTTNTQIEIMELDGTTIASTDITITRRGLKFDGTLTTEVTANKLTWIRNETIVELGSDSPQLFQYLKEYIDGIAIAGSPDASLTAKGLVESATTAEIDAGTTNGATGANLSTRPDQLAASIYGTRLPSAGEKQALAAGSTFGTPSSSNKYLTQEYNSSATGLPVRRVLSTVGTLVGSSTSQFDITNVSGSTYRYTWDGTGTDPSISLVNNPVGSVVSIHSPNFTTANNGVFVLTGAGSNYFEVTNASGVAENNKTLGTGSMVRASSSSVWAKPSGLKYITLEVQGPGNSGGVGTNSGSNDASGAGGGAGAYTNKLLAAASLSSTEPYIVAPASATTQQPRTVFGSTLNIYAQGGGIATGTLAGVGGTATNGGDWSEVGGEGFGAEPDSTGSGSQGLEDGQGGASHFGGGGSSGKSGGLGSAGTNYGSGGGGQGSSNTTTPTPVGAQGVIIITEYYS